MKINPYHKDAICGINDYIYGKIKLTDDMISLFSILCFSIVVGCHASSDGAVLFGHNEDDRNVKEFYMNTSRQGLWAEVPGLKTADTFMNKWGVSIASDNCPSREDKKDLTDGGVLYEVRFAVYEKARSSRDAVRIIGELVEKRGYAGSGRSYIVADSREAWVVSVVRGRHWVAQRVPDDAVMTIPNYYVIGEVDLSDKANFQACPDLVDYAVERGWYDPARDGSFSFRKAYADPATLTSHHNVGRHSAVLSDLGFVYDSQDVPFCVKLQSKLDGKDVQRLLTQPEGVCAPSTIYSAVFHLQRKSSQLWFCPEKPKNGTYSLLCLKDRKGRVVHAVDASK